ncbi:MAG TPA: hypothetical protein VHO28_00665 [Ignavibacteriales bacterium]|nr:hypothetical protein [Ignavibacteriales bacterium]HEX3074085.1 hypothetical protein [Ignavibacteriales bacterium]
MNEERKSYYYLTPALLAVLMFASNFLNTDIFDFGSMNFAVWFLLSLFSFACGWLMDKTLKWKFGGVLLFSVIIAVTIINLMLLTYLKEYFGAFELVVENIIFFTLRNITLGAMAFFGMAVAEVFVLQKREMEWQFKNEAYEQLIMDAKKEAALEVREAKLKAEQIVREAEWQEKLALEKKAKIERSLAEFIDIEKELIKKYEENEE